MRSLVCASPVNLAAHNCLTYAHYGQSLRHFQVDGQHIEAPVSGNFSTNEAAIVARAGVALLPQLHCGR